MSISYGSRPPNKRFVAGGLSTIPEGAQLITVQVKEEYDAIPFHAYHPTQHDAITILRNKKNPHEWLVCGWYVDTLREGGPVKGLVYRKIVEQADRDAVLVDLKKHDKEASAKFEP